MRFENGRDHLCRTARLVDAAEGLPVLLDRFYPVCDNSDVSVPPGLEVGVLDGLGLINSRPRDRLPARAWAPRFPGRILENVNIGQVAGMNSDHAL